MVPLGNMANGRRAMAARPGEPGDFVSEGSGSRCERRVCRLSGHQRPSRRCPKAGALHAYVEADEVHRIL
jgi:hypothetical protein